MNHSMPLFDALNLDRIRTETFVADVDYHHETTSTNDIAIQCAAANQHRLPFLVLAESQTAGRGRGDNRWWSGAGALTFSLVLDATSLNLAPQRWPFLSLTAGLAVCAVVEKHVQNHDTRIKWPNDVYVDRRKICGILTESASGNANALVIGIGLNVNNSLANAPEELRITATSLCDIEGRSVSIVDTLIDLLVQLEWHFRWIDGSREELCERWRKRCLLTGKRVTVTAGSRTITGRCLGIDDDGALLVLSGDNTERCFAGVVSKWSKEDG